ncbi:BsuPI-related putative proteinase inhibitor [Halobacillus hunanensis]|uniref:BsuPI-related putative proteinase inhibitor n=1 Tax=Halobacillus hunanensis TaxID=578214 RepID=UPI0015906490|nr:BsuPI-related putative proteinase inhibitor [Halobacillus hunanensis]
MLKKLSPIMIGLMIILLVACSESNSESTSGGDEEMNKKDQPVGKEAPEYNVIPFIEQLTFDANVKADENQVNVQFSLTNEAEKPVILGFSSSQLYEITIVNEAGETVYKYSEGQMFAQSLTTKDLKPGDQLEAKELVEKELPDGQYEARMTFLVATINDQPLESRPFQITKPFAIGEEVESNPDTGTDKEAANENSSQAGVSLDMVGEVFRNFTLTGENGQYKVTGEANVREGKFYYSVDDGHNVLIESKAVEVEKAAPEWSEFTIQMDIPKDQLPEQGALVMTIYQLDENGQPVNLNYVPLENFG